MKYKSEKHIYRLTNSDIDNCSKYLINTLAELNIERQNRIRIRFTIEEMLLRFRKKFDESTTFQLSLNFRFGSPSLQIDLEGDVYNPLNKVESDLDDWGGSVLTNLGINPQFSYSNGHNILRIAIPTQKMNPILRLLIALVIGVLGGIIIGSLPETSSTIIYDTFFYPVFDLLVRILNLLSGPVIFFMVVTTILGLGRLSGKGTNSKNLVGRYFLITLLVAAFVVITITFFSHLSVSMQVLDFNLLSQILDTFFRVVPAELFTPFMEANTPQLILLGFIIGIILTLLRDQVPILVTASKEANTICLFIANCVSWLVPIFTCILIMLKIGRGQYDYLLKLWKPLVLSIIMTLIVLAIVFIYTSIRKKVRISVLIRKTINPFLLTLKSGSLSASYGQTEASCVRLMGMDKEFVEVSLSHGLVLYMPCSILGAIIFTIRVGAEYQIHVSWLWYIMAVLFVAILMEAAPPVPGVSLLVYAAVFNMLGIPDEALIPGMVFDIVFSIVATAVNQTMLQFEMIFQSDHVGLLNRETLRKPVQ